MSIGMQTEESASAWSLSINISFPHAALPLFRRLLPAVATSAAEGTPPRKSFLCFILEINISIWCLLRKIISLLDDRVSVLDDEDLLVHLVIDDGNMMPAIT